MRLARFSGSRNWHGRLDFQRERYPRQTYNANRF
jgi:hypothetical protein